MAIEETVQYIAETHIFLPILKGKPERWLELVIITDNSISMQIWQPILKEFRRLLQLQGTFRKIHFYQLETENEEARILNNNCVVKNLELISPHQPRLILVLSDCVAKAWHSENGVFNLLHRWSQKHPVSIMQMLPFRLWKGTALGYAEEARLTSALPLALNQKLNIQSQDFWFVDDMSALEKSFKIPVLTLEPEIVKTWAKLVLGKKESWLKGIVKTSPIPLLERKEDNSVEITAEQRIKQFLSFASPVAQKLAAYLATVPLDLSVMNVVQKLMLPQSQQVHLAEVFLGGLLKRVPDDNWVQYDFHPGVRDLLLDTVIVADAVYVLTRVSDFVEQHIGQSLDFLALLANPNLTEGIELNEQTRPFAEVGAKILRRLGGEYEKLVDSLEGKNVDVLNDLKKSTKWDNVPKEIQEQGEAAINSYLESLKRQETLKPLNRVRAIFLGYGAAGKTSLIRALHDEEVINGKEAMTAGIEIRDWQVPDTDITASFWDFGGQVMFHGTHKFLLRSSCVYVIVINALAEIDNSEQAEYWLDHVKVFGGSAPVLLVGNKADEVQINLDMQSLIQKYLNLKGFYPVSCAYAKTSYKRQFDIFKQALAKELQAVGIHQILFTPAQAKVLDELRQYSSDHAFLSESNFNQICDKHGISNEGELNRDWLVDLFDKLGVMFHFEELKTFHNAYMLNPRWLTHGIYTLMYAGQAQLTYREVVSILANANAKVQDDYPHLLSYPPDKCQFIIKAMQRFGLCYPLSNDTNSIIIPALLPNELPNYPFELRNHDSLHFEFAFNGFLPRNLISEFIVSRYEEIKDNLQSQRGAVFKSKTVQAEALVEADYQRRLIIMQVYGEDAKEYLTVLYDTMLEVFGDLNLDYREWVMLPPSACLDSVGYETDRKPEKAPYQQLLASAKIGQTAYISESGIRYDLRKLLWSILSKTHPAHLIGRRILIVEDDVLNCEIICEYLSELGLVLEIAENGLEAIECAKKKYYDLVTMDIFIPIMNGYEATKEIRKEHSFAELPIIALTAQTDREKSLAVGMNDHITKPFYPKTLTEALYRWLYYKDTVIDAGATSDSMSRTPTNTEWLKVFICYSIHDNHYKENLFAHLSALNGLDIWSNNNIWSDDNILPGERWDISKLSKADIVLYLVSANSLATDFIQNIELPLIKHRCDLGKCSFIPIIVEYCDWRQLGFAKYQVLPKNGVPISDRKSWVDENKAWMDIIKGIENIINQHRKSKVKEINETLSDSADAVMDEAKQEVFIKKLHSEIKQILKRGNIAVDKLKQELKLPVEVNLEAVASELIKVEAGYAIAIITRVIQDQKLKLFHTKLEHWDDCYHDAEQLCSWLLINTVDSSWLFNNQIKLSNGITAHFSHTYPPYVEAIISRSSLQNAQYKLDALGQVQPASNNIVTQLFDSIDPYISEIQLLAVIYKDLVNTNQLPDKLEIMVDNIAQRVKAKVRNRNGKPIYYLIDAETMQILERCSWFKPLQQQLTGFLLFICCQKSESYEAQAVSHEEQRALLEQLAELLSLNN